MSCLKGRLSSVAPSQDTRVLTSMSCLKGRLSSVAPSQDTRGLTSMSCLKGRLVICSSFSRYSCKTLRRMKMNSVSAPVNLVSSSFYPGQLQVEPATTAGKDANKQHSNTHI